jgi:hypothetical protein
MMGKDQKESFLSERGACGVNFCRLGETGYHGLIDIIYKCVSVNSLVVKFEIGKSEMQGMKKGKVERDDTEKVSKWKRKRRSHVPIGLAKDQGVKLHLYVVSDFISANILVKR